MNRNVNFFCKSLSITKNSCNLTKIVFTSSYFFKNQFYSLSIFVCKKAGNQKLIATFVSKVDIAIVGIAFSIANFFSKVWTFWRAHKIWQSWVTSTLTGRFFQILYASQIFQTKLLKKEFGLLFTWANLALYGINDFSWNYSNNVGQPHLKL